MKRKFRISNVLLISLYLSAVFILSGCKKDPVLPTIATVAPANITSASATAGGNITSDGRALVTERGICWALTANPTVDNDKIASGTGDGIFSADITGLHLATTYHVRAYAINSVGTAYGEDKEFTTLALTPAVTTREIGAVSWTTATSGGINISDGGSAITARGVCWGTSSGPVVGGSHSEDGSGTSAFVSNLTNLTANTVYYVRAYATNSMGTTYGNELSFRTSPVTVPSLTTDAATGITLDAAVSGGRSIISNGGDITEKGVCWDTNPNPTTSDFSSSAGSGTGNFSADIEGLNPSTIYYVRAYARNSAGFGYGPQMTFSTSASDIDDNVYRTVIIGDQLWMQSDLRTTHFSGGSAIPFVEDDEEWLNLTTYACCWYNNTPPAAGSGYGLIYNWYAVETEALCPTGWHVPTDEEFKVLERHLGMTPAQYDGTGWRGTDQGSQMKSTSSLAWVPSTGTNSSGFTALGEGYRYGVLGNFADYGTVGYWWTSTLHWDTTKALYRRLDSIEARIYREGVIFAGGKSVRCIKD
jgi:uncharacterized protein (TIGR02145 family)